jgi:signal transduction histidine kinase
MESKDNTIDSNMCDNCEKLYELSYENIELRKQIDSLNENYSKIKQQNLVLEDKLQELQKNNEELERIQLEKNDLFTIIVHDIKNPTIIIKSLVELLRTYDNHSVEQQAIMNDLVESTRQIINLSTEISKVLNLERTFRQMSYEWADPKRLVTEIIHRNSINAKNKDQTINIEVEDNLPQFQVDVTKICEVFDNMLSNSIKYTHKGGKITVKLSKVEENIQVEFADNGLGMSEDDLKYAFLHGKKLSARPTGDGETSSGFGLWIVKKIVEAHNGRVWVTSSLGIGTVFTIHIPINPHILV